MEIPCKLKERINRFRLFQEELYSCLEEMRRVNEEIITFDLLQPEEIVFDNLLLSAKEIKQINAFCNSERDDAIADFFTVIRVKGGFVVIGTVLLYQCYIQQGKPFLKQVINNAVNDF